MTQAAVRQASYSEILADPLFRTGYEEIWRAEGHAVDLGWSDEEKLAYERGRQFGIYVLTSEQQRVPLNKGALPHPRAVTMLIMAFRTGDVL